jgi:transcriptional regulator with PAS, ATPase and Fis domain
MITRVGANPATPVNIRLVCATNMPIHTMVQEGTFRQDLLYRINTVEIHMPPLSERVEDIPMLAQHFLEFYARKYHKTVSVIATDAMDRLKRYAWPGNIRELQHAIERAVIMTDSATLQESDFLLSRSLTSGPANNTLNLDEVERAAIAKALQMHNGNISKAADELGLTRASLYRRMEKYAL